MNGCCSVTSKMKILVVALALIGGTALITRSVVRADDKKADAKMPGGKEMSAEEKAMMEKFMAAATPGPEHKRLEMMIGDWTTVTKSQMDPKAPIEESTGKATFKSMMDGRFIVQEFDGKMMDMPFKGFGVTGYDNVQKKYVSIWMDTMTTSMMTMSGTADASGKVITEEGEMPCCMTGKMTKFKAICRLESPSKHVFEMHSPDESGKMFKCLEVTYTRK